MKDYIIAWLLSGVLTFAGLFALGFVIGMVGAITGGVTDPDQLQASSWFGPLVMIGMFIINFFAFRFTVNKFIVKDK